MSNIDNTDMITPFLTNHVVIRQLKCMKMIIHGNINLYLYERNTMNAENLKHLFQKIIYYLVYSSKSSI